LKNLQLRHDVFNAVREYLSDCGFMELETPLLTKSTPEGARDFLVPSRIMSGKFYALPQSPQLFKQIFMVAGIDKYFQIARCFRDEDLRADRQPEFTQLDIECSFVDEEDIMNLVESLIKHMFKEILDINLELPFPRISHKEALEKYNTDKPDLSSENDRFKFLWVYDFPMFKYDEETKTWGLEHHPFTSPKIFDSETLHQDKSSILARAYDLVVDGVEIASGSIRIHDSKMQEEILKLIGLDKEEYMERFGFLLDALSLGAPPHGGIAFGLDRLVALIIGCESIRDVIPFPKTQAGICPLTGAPTGVSEEQLKDLRLKIRKKQEGDK
jgi:aspartyl-tRNA synthetase